MKYTKMLWMISLLISSGSASAEFFEGFDKGNAVGQGAGTGQVDTSATGQSYGTGASEANAQGSGQGNADGEVDFAVTFKGKGNTTMASDAAGSGQGNTNANLYGYTDAYGSGYSNLYGYGNSYTNNVPWGYYPMPYAMPGYGYNPMLMGYGNPMITQAPSFDQVQQQMSLPMPVPAH